MRFIPEPKLTPAPSTAAFPINEISSPLFFSILPLLLYSQSNPRFSKRLSVTSSICEVILTCCISLSNSFTSLTAETVLSFFPTIIIIFIFGIDDTLILSPKEFFNIALTSSADIFTSFILSV